MMNDLVQELKKIAQAKEKFVIVIDGMSASGKSTFAQKLASELDANLIKMDDFFLPKELRTLNRYQEAGGNIHYERFKEEVVDHINENISYGIFDCKSMKILKKVNVLKKKFIIIEGAYSMHPYFGKYY
ncbi:MAG: (d)CMP kinase, partial [Anaeroplasmataceae bacterium]|nr:(d)CMP kinase [Anaeroplasmataceae bacterium]